MGGGPPGFPRGFTCPVVLGVRPGERSVSATGLLPSTAGHSRPLRLRFAFLTPCGTPHNPEGESLRFGLFPFRSPLLGESRFLSLPRGTKMFQFPRSASRCPMDSGRSTGGSPPVGCPIRKSPDQSLLTAPRGISVFAPSFIGSWRQGIHRVPFTTSPQLLR